MATAVLMPKQGQSVESCIIIEWKKAVGDTVAEGETLCDVETDKATLEVVSPAAGTVLALLFAAGDEVPVLETIAWVGAPGESVSQSVGASVDGASVDGASVEVAATQSTADDLRPTT